LPLWQILVTDVLLVFIDEQLPKLARPQEVKARVKRISRFFANDTLADLTSQKCRDYVKQRGSEQAGRRELADLSSAINFYFRDEVIRPNIRLEMPPVAVPRDRWLTRSEAAKLLWTAWRRKAPIPNGAERYSAKHVARFVLTGLHSARASAICGAALRPIEGQPYVDVERGVFYRKAAGARQTSKCQPSVRLPRKLPNHIQRWQRLGLCENYIVEWNHKPVERISQAFRRIARDAGLPDVTPHVLRHTAITWALQNGATMHDVAGFFGVSEAVLRRHYGHHSPTTHTAVAASLDRSPVALRRTKSYK
jgi:integrase